MIVLVVIVGFLFLDPLGKTAGVVFRADPFLSPQARYFFDIFIQIIENHQKCVFFNLSAPWQETFADAGDGDEGGPFGTI